MTSREHMDILFLFGDLFELNKHSTRISDLMDCAEFLFSHFHHMIKTKASSLLDYDSWISAYVKTQ